jgi:hypothetical protein
MKISWEIRNLVNVIQQCICLLQLKYNQQRVTFYKFCFSTFFPLYRLPAFPILPVNYSVFTISPVNLKPGKSSTLLGTPLFNNFYCPTYCRHSIFNNYCFGQLLTIKRFNVTNCCPIVNDTFFNCIFTRNSNCALLCQHPKWLWLFIPKSLSKSWRKTKG